MSKPPIFSEPQADGAPSLPIRSLVAMLARIDGDVHDDMRGDGGFIESLVCLGPPPGFLPAVAWVLLTGGALGAHVQLADKAMNGGARDANDPKRFADLPDAEFWARCHGEAWAHLADVTRGWCQAAEVNAEAMDKAAREVAAGRAVLDESGDARLVRPVAQLAKAGA